MIPRTDKERILQLEALNGELEAELAEYRRAETETRRSSEKLDSLDSLRAWLRRGHQDAGGPAISLMLETLLEASPRTVGRDRMFVLSRARRSWAEADGELRTLDVQICRLRKALANLGFPDVIKTINGRGWAIEPNDRDMIKAALGL